MADRLELQVITPSKLAVDEEVDEVVAPGELGEFGVLPSHLPFITLLAPGELRFIKGGTETKLIVWGGLAEVRDDKVKILTDNVEDPRKIDAEAARREAESISEEMRNFDGNPKELKELNRRLRLAQARARML
ncbi:MAG TPA: ATP synthase F1 subunit epsilon [Thermodesulfobacteriota bacterium]|nr:ATP synthase F1 subunit epsilon [Thermodesulfobacteriota bacterium]